MMYVVPRPFANRPALRRGLLLSCLLAGFSVGAHAGYAQLSPPATWSPGTGAGAVYQAAANESWTNQTVRTNATLNVSGRAVTMPATMRLAANAPRIAAQFAFRNPLVAIASVAVTSWLAEGQIQWDANGQRWVKNTPQTPVVCTAGETGCVTAYRGVSYPKSGGGSVGPGSWVTSISEACAQAGSHKVEGYNGTGTGTYIYVLNSTSVCSVDYTVKYRSTGATYYTTSENVAYEVGQVKFPNQPATVPLTETEFSDIMAPKPLPNLTPTDLPTPLPVQRPLLNPVPLPSGTPSPMRVPLGEPTPVPNTNPQQYSRPVADVIPSGTDAEPWRVDVQPRDVITTDPNALPDPNPQTDGAPKPETDPCTSNPNRAGCADLDIPEGDIPKENKNVTFAPVDLGVNQTGCPSPLTVNMGPVLGTRSLSFTPFCDAATSARPFVVAASAVAAMMILLAALKV